MQHSIALARGASVGGGRGASSAASATPCRATSPEPAVLLNHTGRCHVALPVRSGLHESGESSYIKGVCGLHEPARTFGSGIPAGSTE